jgi:hypothetical protein
MDPKETQREKRNRVRREKRLQEKKEREERAALEEEKRLKRNLASKKSKAKSRALAKMKLNTPATPATPPTPTAMKTPDGRSANIDTIQGSAPRSSVQRQWLERQFDKERDHERGNLNLLVRVVEKVSSDISASSQKATSDISASTKKASGDMAALLNSVQQYCVLTANSGTERAQYLVSTYGNGDSDDMGMLAADTSDGLFGGLARNDDEAAANKTSDCVPLALFGSSGVASCPKSPTIATQSMNSLTTKESSFFGGNDTTHSSGSTGGFTFGANAAESTPAQTASPFPMAAGGAGTTFGKPFTFGTSMVTESTQSPTTSTFTGLAGGAYSGEGNEKGATFEFGATFGGPFTFGSNAAMESSPAPSASTFTTAAGAYSGEGNEKGATFEFGATFGGAFTFGSNAATESSPAPSASTFTTAAGAYSGEGNEKGATFEFGATFGGPFTFGSNAATESSPAPSASTFTTVAGGATFDRGTENKATFAFGANAGVDLRGYPVNRMPLEVPLEELDSNSVLARVPVSSPPPSTTLGANKNKRRRLDDGPSEMKRMK